MALQFEVHISDLSIKILLKSINSWYSLREIRDHDRSITGVVLYS